MKVLYIGHYHERSGWGNMCQNYIRALDAAGVDVVPRPIVLSGGADIHPRIKELEAKDESGATHCIQNLLPHYMVYSSSFEKNVGMFLKEGVGSNHMVWSNHLNLMDEVWVANTQMQKEFKNSKLVPLPADLSVYEKPYEPVDIPGARGDYVFYTIGEQNYRKRLSHIIKAFHIAFSPNEPVSLVIKVNGKDPQELAKDVQSMCSKIKGVLKLYKDEKYYKNENIITQYVSNDVMMGLHTMGDCFVNASFGESWCMPAFDAMTMGNFVVSSNEGGPKDFLEKYNKKFLVDGVYEPCNGWIETFFELGSARESWYNTHLNDLVFGMQMAYASATKANQETFIQDYSLKSIGARMKELL